MVDTLHTRMSDEGESDGENDDINFAQIEYNKLIYEGLQNYQRGDLLAAIKNYEDSQIFMQGSRDVEKVALIKINLGILYFQNCEFSKATELLENTLEALKKETKKSDVRMSLLVKLYSNLTIIYIVTSNYQKGQTAINEVINIIYKCQDKQRKILLEELMYIFFRFPSFKTMTDDIIEDFEKRFKGPTLACFYSSMGLNKELIQDPVAAYNFHKKALQQWKECNEHGFVLLSLKHLINLASEVKPPQDETNEHNKLFTKLLETDQFRGIDQKILFKNFENKLTCAKEITSCLKKLEDKPAEQKSRVSMDPNREFENLGGAPLWKQG